MAEAEEGDWGGCRAARTAFRRPQVAARIAIHASRRCDIIPTSLGAVRCGGPEMPATDAGRPFEPDQRRACSPAAPGRCSPASWYRLPGGFVVGPPQATTFSPPGFNRLIRRTWNRCWRTGRAPLSGAARNSLAFASNPSNNTCWSREGRSGIASPVRDSSHGACEANSFFARRVLYAHAILRAVPVHTHTHTHSLSLSLSFCA